MANDRDAFPWPSDSTAQPVLSALLSDAVEVLNYTGALWENIHSWEFNEWRTSTTDTASEITILQFALYQKPGGALPNSGAEMTRIASWDHTLSGTGYDVTAIGSTITVEGGHFALVFGRSPSTGVGTSFRMDSWGANDLSIVTNASLGVPNLFPSRFKMPDTPVVFPAPGTLAGTIIGQPEAVDVAVPIFRPRFV